LETELIIIENLNPQNEWMHLPFLKSWRRYFKIWSEAFDILIEKNKIDNNQFPKPFLIKPFNKIQHRESRLKMLTKGYNFETNCFGSEKK
jgi:hypothetical protein